MSDYTPAWDERSEDGFPQGDGIVDYDGNPLLTVEEALQRIRKDGQTELADDIECLLKAVRLIDKYKDRPDVHGIYSWDVAIDLLRVSGTAWYLWQGDDS